jgi:hypothetical protein
MSISGATAGKVQQCELPTMPALLDKPAVAPEMTSDREKSRPDEPRDFREIRGSRKTKREKP